MTRSTSRKHRVRRYLAAVGAGLALASSLASPAVAGVPRTTQWVCLVPEEDGSITRVVFVSAPAVALRGIAEANSTAGETFADNFGESCTVQ